MRHSKLVRAAGRFEDGTVHWEGSFPDPRGRLRASFFLCVSFADLLYDLNDNVKLTYSALNGTNQHIAHILHIKDIQRGSPHLRMPRNLGAEVMESKPVGIPKSAAAR